VGWGVNAHC